MNRKAVMMFALMISGCGFVSAGINFMNGPLSEAITRAEKNHQPVMIDFITDWCRWCDTLDARTYSDPRVADLINHNVVPVKIDAEKGEGIAIAGKYGVHAYPTILLIQPGGEEIDRLVGYVQADPFLSSMQDYLKGVNTLSGIEASLKKNPGDASLHYALAVKYRDRDNWTSAAEHFQRVVELDRTNALGHNEEAEYSVAVASFKSESDPQKLEVFIGHYPQSPLVKEALYSLWRTYIKAKDGAHAQQYFGRYMALRPDDAGMMNNYAWGCAEQGINLEHAREIARKAVGLARKNDDRAMFLDTEAAVEFALGNSDGAITLEQQALDLLHDASPKARKPYDEAMAKFRAATSHPPATGQPGTHRATGQ